MNNDAQRELEAQVGRPFEGTASSDRATEARLRAMAETFDDVFWIATTDMSQWIYVSPVYARIWGRPIADLYARADEWLESIVPDDRESVSAARTRLADGDEYRVEYRICRPDGEQRWIAERGLPTDEFDGERQAKGVAVDITRHKQLESRFLQAQKMEALGQLAGGVAHDFNNLLTVITGFSRLLLDGDDLPPQLVEPITQIYTAGARATNLTRQLLVFSRKQVVHQQIVDLNEIVVEIGVMLRRLIGEHIRLVISPSPMPSTVEADGGMMEQVIMNLAINARDAMANGGTLYVSLEPVAIIDAASRRHPQARPGKFVCVRVSDTGSGMTPDVLNRIFEPFFTTKEEGHGTGLGLATVFGIVQQHEGWIEVESAVGTGSSFRVLLPAVDAKVAAARAAKPAIPLGGSETVLLVEDEYAVRELAAAVLRSHGYRVLQATSGTEALEVWQWHGPRIALLFSDLVLPDGPGGLELAEQLRRDKPTLRVVITSGYASDEERQDFVLPAGARFIRKPYKPQALAQLVREALDGHVSR